jgi:small-conductance mechanosensitive channel
MASMENKMARSVIPSLQRLFLYLIITLAITIGILYIFHQFIAEPISLSKLFEQAAETIIAISAWLLAALIIRRFKPPLAQRIGDQAATITQYVMLAIASLLLLFGLLDIIQVSAAALIAGAGIITITAGLVISTFVGSILSGVLVFINYRYRVGDEVIVNNIPGEIVEMTPLLMRIQTGAGVVTIPNSAIASGGVIITSIRDHQTLESRLRLKAGDRVVTPFMNEAGVVKEITPFCTIIHLDSGKEIQYLNNNILAGTVIIARITDSTSTGRPST